MKIIQLSMTNLSVINSFAASGTYLTLNVHLIRSSYQDFSPGGVVSVLHKPLTHLPSFLISHHQHVQTAL